MRKPNISWLTEQIATGGDFSFIERDAEHQFNQLIAMGVGTVIDCRVESNDFHMWAGSGVDYFWLPTDDSVGHVIPQAHFDKAVAAARVALEEGGKVFVHCHMGVNRGPSTAMAVLMDQGMLPEDAFDLIREKRPQAGVIYDVDAVRAHYTRKGWSKQGIAHRIMRYERHRDSVYGAKQRAQVQHIIRRQHLADREDLQSLR